MEAGVIWFIMCLNWDSVIDFIIFGNRSVPVVDFTLSFSLSVV